MGDFSKRLFALEVLLKEGAELHRCRGLIAQDPLNEHSRAVARFDKQRIPEFNDRLAVAVRALLESAPDDAFPALAPAILAWGQAMEIAKD